MAYIRLEIVDFHQAGVHRPEPVFAIPSNDNCFRVVPAEPLGPRGNVKSAEVTHRETDVNNGTSSANHNRRTALNNCMGKFAHPVLHQEIPTMSFVLVVKNS